MERLFVPDRRRNSGFACGIVRTYKNSIYVTGEAVLPKLLTIIPLERLAEMYYKGAT